MRGLRQLFTSTAALNVAKKTHFLTQKFTRAHGILMNHVIEEPWVQPEPIFAFMRPQNKVEIMRVVIQCLNNVRRVCLTEQNSWSVFRNIFFVEGTLRCSTIILLNQFRAKVTNKKMDNLCLN